MKCSQNYSIGKLMHYQICIKGIFVHSALHNYSGQWQLCIKIILFCWIINIFYSDYQSIFITQNIFKVNVDSDADEQVDNFVNLFTNSDMSQKWDCQTDKNNNGFSDFYDNLLISVTYAEKIQLMKGKCNPEVEDISDEDFKRFCIINCSQC